MRRRLNQRFERTANQAVFYPSGSQAAAQLQRELSMLVLRCTQKLLKKNPGPTEGGQDALVPVLGSWHANLIRLAHSPIVLCVNDNG
jgi:hypothetical protein